MLSHRGSIQCAIIRASSGRASRMLSNDILSIDPDLNAQSNAATATSNGSSRATDRSASARDTLVTSPSARTASSSQWMTTSSASVGLSRRNRSHCSRSLLARRGTDTCSGWSIQVQAPRAMRADIPVNLPPTLEARKAGSLSLRVEYQPCRARMTEPLRTAAVSAQS